MQIKRSKQQKSNRTKLAITDGELVASLEGAIEL
jgi:hypothetical protein